MGVATHNILVDIHVIVVDVIQRPDLLRGQASRSGLVRDIWSAKHRLEINITPFRVRNDIVDQAVLGIALLQDLGTDDAEQARWDVGS